MRRALELAMLACALAIPGAARADSLQEIFARANAAYFRGEYDAAAEDYRRLVAAGVHDADVAYNLGAADAKRGRHGAAIHMFERALWLRPGDADAERALGEVRSTLGRRRAAARGESEVHAAGLGEAVFGGLSPGLLAGLALALDLVFFAVLAALVLVRRESLRLGLGIAAVVSGAALITGGLGLASRSGWLDEGKPAVVLEERAALREGPDHRASERHHAPEGQRAWVLARERDYWRVRVPGVGEGWMEAGALGLVRPEDE